MLEPDLSLEQAKEAVSTKTAPRVTEQSIKNKIANVQFQRSDVLTICIITMQNGFHLVGTSAPASPTNYDQAVGERYAYDNAFKQLWPLEGYLLREQLSKTEGSAKQ